MSLAIKTTSNLKMFLSAVGVAALLASPVLAKSVRHQPTAPSSAYVPGNGHGFVGPYTPHAPAYRDFQDSPGRMG
jgi:hypothetical protein